MADARRLIATVLGLALAPAVGGMARADEACELERRRTGVALEMQDDALVVAAVDAESAGADGGLRPGDAVVQVNGVVTRTCADWARALRDARRERKALLVLVRRQTDDRLRDVPLAVAATTWERAAPAAPAVAGGPTPTRRVPVEAPSVGPLVASAPPTIPPESQTTVEDVVHALTALDGGRPALPAYEDAVERLRAGVRDLPSRSIPPPVITGLETVLRYHDAAVVAWRSEQAERERQRRSSRLPSPDSMDAPFFTDSEEETTIEAFPFLHDTVRRDPRPGAIGESAGVWRPVEARRLLWEHARAERDRLATWLGMAGR